MPFMMMLQESVSLQRKICAVERFLLQFNEEQVAFVYLMLLFHYIT